MSIKSANKARRETAEAGVVVTDDMMCAAHEVLDRWKADGYELRIGGSTLSNTARFAFIEQIYKAMRVFEPDHPANAPNPKGVDVHQIWNGFEFVPVKAQHLKS